MRLAILFSLLFAFSCGVKRISIDELKAYVLEPENGLIKHEKIDEKTIVVVYRPRELVIAGEVGIDDNERWMETARDLDSVDYFVIRLAMKGHPIENQFGGDPNAFQKVVSYLSEGISDDIKLKIQDEYLEPINIVFVPSLGASRETNILIAFNSFLDKRDSDFSLIFDGSKLGVGGNEFSFRVRDVKAIPALRK